MLLKDQVNRTNRGVVVALMVAFAVVAFASARSLAVADDEWKVLGDTRVSQRAETDEIKVGAAEGLLKRIKLEVRGADVEFKRVTVQYAAGEDEAIDVRDKVKRGGQTRPIDLKGGNRAIKKVVFLYKADSGADRDARVILLGQK